MLIVVLLSLVSIASASTMEKFTLPDGSEWSGCFSKPCTVDPNTTLFMIVRKIDGLRGKKITGGLSAWNYRGRTGEKTFSIVQSSLRSEQSPTSLYFTPNDTFVLAMAGNLPGCTANDKINLKMIDLKGNYLTYKIELPECYKK